MPHRLLNQLLNGGSLSLAVDPFGRTAQSVDTSVPQNGAASNADLLQAFLQGTAPIPQSLLAACTDLGSAPLAGPFYSHQPVATPPFPASPAYTSPSNTPPNTRPCFSRAPPAVSFMHNGSGYAHQSLVPSVGVPPTGHVAQSGPPVPAVTPFFVPLPEAEDLSHEAVQTVLRANQGPVDETAPLAARWVFWATWKLETDQQSIDDTQQIGVASTLEEFWDCCDLLTPTDMPVNVSLQVFREGVPPVYDHPENRNGGHFKIRAATTEIVERMWLSVLHATVAGNIALGQYIQGCNVVKKGRSTTVQVWLGSSASKLVIDTIQCVLASSLPRDDYVRMKFCPHKYLLRTLQTKEARRKWREG